MNPADREALNGLMVITALAAFVCFGLHFVSPDRALAAFGFVFTAIFLFAFYTRVRP